jgi:hypothetical protein
MRTIPTECQALHAVTLLGVVPLSGAPSASAATVSTDTAPQAVVALPAPTLDIATIKGDNVQLIWTPPAQREGVTNYGIYADGTFLFRTGGSADSAPVYLASEGLTGREVFTVVAEGGVARDGTPLGQSPPSNGLVPVTPATLPAPELTSAVRQGDWGGIVTLTWTPSQSEQKDIPYSIFADGPSVPNGHALVWSVTNEMTATFVAVGCDGVCPLPGTEVYTVVASDRTKAESPPSNGLVATAR